jgi:hypothetical protein
VFSAKKRPNQAAAVLPAGVVGVIRGLVILAV